MLKSRQTDGLMIFLVFKIFLVVFGLVLSEEKITKTQHFSHASGMAVEMAMSVCW